MAASSVHPVLDWSSYFVNAVYGDPLTVGLAEEPLNIFDDVSLESAGSL
jgi:hypothetical protein